FWRGYNQHCKYFNGWVNGTDWHPIQWDGYETEALNRFAFKFLDEAQQRDEPFCLFISPQPPHWGEPPEQMAPSRYYEDLPASENLPLDPDVTEFDLPNRRKDLRQYLAMIRAVDDMVGDLVAQLTRRQLIDNTLLVFTSDHGTQGGREQLSFWAKMHPHEASIRVPLIVRWPGMIPAGVRNNSMMSAVDFLPTLASLCGIDAPRGLEGMDLSASWMGQPNAPRRDHTLLMNFGRKHDYFADGWEWRGIRTMTHTYARWLNGRTELFDIIADPYQLQNLAGTPAVAALQSDLEQCLTDRLAERADHFGTCTSYRAWHDSLRRVVRNGFGPLPHPESEPDWTRFCQPTHP
ncbi:MAG TPA: sulfatase-like hydrolase/transferase, partial [Tepidisphaeraceae bacterium]|nr:sulfatase-like hydrolase/transferase [Tepidisphaeraceae bacterium]